MVAGAKGVVEGPIEGRVARVAVQVSEAVSHGLHTMQSGSSLSMARRGSVCSGRVDERVEE